MRERSMENRCPEYTLTREYIHNETKDVEQGCAPLLAAYQQSSVSYKSCDSSNELEQAPLNANRFVL